MSEELLEFKLVTIPLDVKMSPAPNIEGRVVLSGKYFGVAILDGGRVAVKDWVGEGDLLNGFGTMRGYSTYTFVDGSTLNLSFAVEIKEKGTHGEYTITSGTGAYANATGGGAFEPIPTKWTNGAWLFDVKLNVKTP